MAFVINAVMMSVLGLIVSAMDFWVNDLTRAVTHDVLDDF